MVGNILTITNNGTASDIDLTPYLDNSDTQLTEAEVDAFANDNGYLTAEADGSVSNEIQDLQLVGNILTITNNGTATDIDLTPYLDNTNTQLTEAEVDGFAGNNGYLTAEVDGSILNEIQNLSADAPVGTNRTINISGGTSTTISIADNDNSTSNETISTTSYETNNTIRFVEGAVNKDLYIGTLNADLDADNNKIINVANPVNAQDAVNLQFLEAKDATDYAINASINYFNPSGTWEIFGFSGVSLDKGNLISGGVITISEAGVYSVSVQGFSALSVGSDIDILINGLSGSATPVLRSVNIYIGTYLFDLSIGDTILLYYKSSGPAESISLQTSIFKI